MIYDSPMEAVEANLYFKQLMGDIQEKDSELGSSLAALLSEEDQNKLSTSFSDIEEMKRYVQG